MDPEHIPSNGSFMRVSFVHNSIVENYLVKQNETKDTSKSYFESIRKF